MVKEALRANDAIKVAGLQHIAELFRSGNTAGLPISLHDFLKRINQPIIHDLDKLVIQELKSRRERDRRFGDLSAHNHLTLAEIQNVARQVATVDRR